MTINVESEIKKNPTVQQVFKNFDFFKLWIAQLVSNTGSGITFIVLPLFIFAFTGSTYWLGFITLAEFIPVLIISPVAGMFVDSHDRKLIMIESDIFNSIFMLLIPILITFDFVLIDQVVLYGISLLVFLGSSANRYFMPARMASIPNIVKKDELGIAISIEQTTYQMMLALGPILGGIIVSFFGYRTGFIIDASTFLFSAFVASRINKDLQPDKIGDSDRQKKPGILLGTKKMFHIKSLRYVVILFSFLIFANSSLNSFLVAFVKRSELTT